MSKDWIWVEKYRPKKLGEFVGNSDLKEVFRKWIEQGECQHCILAGPPGTGKTTAARILWKEIGAEGIELNASDERGIDVIRDKVKRYASIQTHGNLKIILLDEADYLTSESQTALRGIIEKFTRGTRFILTCNYPNKILDAIQSRCRMVKIAGMPKRDMMIRLGYILRNEKVLFEVPEVVKLVKLYYPDMRRIINALQFYSQDGRLKIDFDRIIDKDYRLKILGLLKKKAWKDIRQIFANDPIDETEIFHYLFGSFEDNPRAMLIIAEYMWRDSQVADKEINLMACILELMEMI